MFVEHSDLDVCSTVTTARTVENATSELSAVLVNQDTRDFFVMKRVPRELTEMVATRNAGAKMAVPAIQLLAPAFAHREFKARVVKMDVPQELSVKNARRNVHSAALVDVATSSLDTVNVILVSLDLCAIFLAPRIPLDQIVEVSASASKNIRRNAIQRQGNVNVKWVSPVQNVKLNVLQTGGEKLVRILATAPLVPSVILEMEIA